MPAMGTGLRRCGDAGASAETRDRLVRSSVTHGAAGRSGPFRRSAAGAGRCRDRRRRHHRHQHRAVSGRKRRLGGIVRKGAHCRRAVEPQLGLVPQNGARPARAAADHREPAAVAGHQRAGRGRHRLSPMRHHVSGREPGRVRAARNLVRSRPTIPARHPASDASRGGRADAGADRRLGRRALHRKRR